MLTVIIIKFVKKIKLISKQVFFLNISCSIIYIDLLRIGGCMGQLVINLMGRFTASLSAAPITSFETNKVKGLLAFLAAEPDRAHAREMLAGLLWPDSSQPAAMESLRHALASLRRAIGDPLARPPYLLISREALQINRQAALQVDLWDLEQLLAQQPAANRQTSIAGLGASLARYPLPFLEGFLSGSELFDQWLRADAQASTAASTRCWAAWPRPLPLPEIKLPARGSPAACWSLSPGTKALTA